MEFEVLRRVRILFFVKHYCAKAKNRTLAPRIKQNAGAEKWFKIKVHNSKISSDLELTGGMHQLFPIYKVPLYGMCPSQESLLTLCNTPLNASHPSIIICL